MKKTILLFAFISCLVFNNFAQNCQIVKEKKDSFTNQVERSASVTLGDIFTRRWLIEFSQINGQSTMQWGVKMDGEQKLVFEKGTSLLLKLKDGTILNLKTTEQSDPVTQMAGAGFLAKIITIFNLKFNLPVETLNLLSKNPIVDMKVEVPNQVIKNPEIRADQMEEFRTVCECLLVK